MDNQDKVVRILPHLYRNRGLEKFLQKVAPELELYEVEASFQEIPLLGTVAAGKPIEPIEERGSLTIPADMAVGRYKAYALQVKGDSMIEEGIRDGDYIIIQEKNEAKNGETVVALINDQEVTLKKLYIERDHIRLQPANSQMEPIIIHNGDVKVLGVVCGLIRKFR
ncbi:MAG: repressor LexA [Candidatus Tectomicrobia bacterium]|uniref:Repressor LexA n=1 Tax=Tectimicrobiota bacterium TaxID=2528274 RepID=A0A932CRV7_UNCTE|nr:repressor LexA [Candidatus Tectomicrobia bacterium]